MLASRPALTLLSPVAHSLLGALWRRSISTAIVGCLSLTLAACGGGGGGGGGGFSGSSSGSSSGGSSSGGGTAPVTPVWSIGAGAGSGFKDGIIDSNKTTLNAGETATLRVNVVDQAGNPPTSDFVVNFSSTCNSSGLATFGTISQVTRGLFSVDYSNKGCDRAEDTITATLTSNGKQATVKVGMVGPEVLTVNFVSATTTQLALAGIGGNETAEMVFSVLGAQGVPVVGKTVNFSINTQVGGASILAGRTSGTTDQAGQVRTVVKSGTIAGPVNVRAVESATGKQGISPDVVISTGVPDANRFSLSYAPPNPAQAFGADGIEVTVSIIASDIFGNNPTNGTRVSFVSPESGNVQNSCVLQNGVCSVVWRSSGSRPANMRATVLAYTSGAEHFTDKNGNSVYDAADGAMLASDDKGEPFADENENNSYDVGEYFFDTNKNGVRDGGNGKWDGPCLNKVDPTAICTGESSISISGSAVIVMSRSDVRIKNLGTFPTTGSTVTLTQGTSVSFAGMVVSDGNANADALGGNPLPVGTTVNFKIEGTGASVRGISNYTIVNGTAPENTPSFGITVAADKVDAGDPAPTNVSLTMTVTAPGLTTVYTWPLNITL